MQISGIMTPSPRTVQPGDTAQAMDELNNGVRPVCESGTLVGLVTDRDLVIRSVSAGQDPSTATIAEAMTTDPRTLHVDDTVMAAIQMMEEQQLRRVPVLDGQGKLAGIVSLGDLAAVGTPEAADALEAISTPAEPDR